MYIGYLGPEGTYSHQAACQWSSQDDTLVSCRSFFDLFERFVSKKLDKLIAPIENSIEGSVAIVMDSLLTNPGYIIGECSIAVTHSLLARPGYTHTDTPIIVSHAQALAQCQHYINRRFPTAKLQAVESTAQAAQLAASTASMMAIGSPVLAGLYGLDCIDEMINDVSPNHTRFIVLSHTPVPRTGNDKTSMIIFPTENKPGILADTLVYFAQAGINLTKIESRPARTVLGQYIFYIDFFDFSIYQFHKVSKLIL